MNQGDRFNTVLAFAERGRQLRVVEIACLHSQQAGDQLEVILDAVMDFLEQNFFLRKRVGQTVALGCQGPGQAQLLGRPVDGELQSAVIRSFTR